ncbi:MAG TPA: TRAP transporter small permease [Rhizobiales bacterium]|uniref:TRAP transporter small permease protein n=2 Tax=Cohaesibacter gelatinilyticus TaxID=372072 RepID=A0A285PGM2_9HYPH|nr:TRAP-type C4-dicarboxylate transport system, small permease component [Cohaesibacter gelatinilyticus]HAT87884.1 TRAP transporter small permease [Hyphomicrobiales bacterium]
MNSENLTSVRLQRAERLTRWTLEASMVFFGLGLAGLMFAQVILRELDSAFLGFEEAAILLGLWVYFLGFAYGTWQKCHIAGGLETLIIRSQRTRHWHELFISFASLCFLLFILFRAWDYFAFTSGNGRVSTYLRWPRGLWASSLLIGISLSCLAELFHFFTSLKRLYKG